MNGYLFKKKKKNRLVENKKKKSEKQRQKIEWEGDQLKRGTRDKNQRKLEILLISTSTTYYFVIWGRVIFSIDLTHYSMYIKVNLPTSLVQHRGRNKTTNKIYRGWFILM